MANVPAPVDVLAAAPMVAPINPQMQQAMAVLMQAMAQHIQNPPVHDNVPVLHTAPHHVAPRPRINTRDPNPYDGTNPTKLCAFISQCKLVFHSCPDNYEDDQNKITYAVSWLKGMALCWYEPNILLNDDKLPDYATNWNDFKETLKTTFGEPDPITMATNKLDNLNMKDTHHLTCYNVEFTKYTAKTSFNECALYTKYYKGLALCIKDVLVYSGHLNTLVGLCTHAQALNSCYWECKDEDHYKMTPISMSGLQSTPLGTSPATSSSSNSY
jgi:hypothetical protein